jgi:hypothetical protein
LPQNLTLSEFPQAFLGVNYGSLGAGNVDSVFPLLTLSSVPEPQSVILLVIGILGVFASAAPRMRLTQH